MVNQNVNQPHNTDNKPFDRDERKAEHDRQDEQEKKDHGPNLPEKNLNVNRSSTPQIDPSEKQEDSEESQH